MFAARNMRRSTKRELERSRDADSQSSSNYAPGDIQSICNGFVSALQNIAATRSIPLAQPGESQSLQPHRGTIANNPAEDDDDFYEKSKKRQISLCELIVDDCKFYILDLTYYHQLL